MPTEPTTEPTAAPTSPTPSATAPATTAREALDQLRALFDTLVPPDAVEVVDVFGNRHPLRGRLPARSQIMVMQQLDRIASTESGLDVSALVASTRGGGLPAVIRVVIRAATEAGVLDGIAQAFEVAHPQAVAEARRLGGAEGARAINAADLFGVEEMAAGLVPFCIALAKRFATMAAEMVPQSQSTAH